MTWDDDYDDDCEDAEDTPIDLNPHSEPDCAEGHTYQAWLDDNDQPVASALRCIYCEHRTQPA